jgi:hypothetical protein
MTAESYTDPNASITTTDDTNDFLLPDGLAQCNPDGPGGFSSQLDMDTDLPSRSNYDRYTAKTTLGYTS